MGTSQSHSLKTTPQWSATKKAMTSVIKDHGNAQKQSRLMTAFGTAVGDGLYRGGNRGGGGSFGQAGSRALGNVVQFISDVRSLGIGGAIDRTATGRAASDSQRVDKSHMWTDFSRFGCSTR